MSYSGYSSIFNLSSFLKILDLSRQGTNQLYSGQGIGTEGFDKGHLNAAHINSFDKQHVLATFTYSNAVQSL